MLENDITLQNLNPLIEIEDNTENYTLIEIADKTYAIKTNEVLEITKIMALEYPSNLLSCILGITKYKNQPVGVIDLREIIQTERIIYDLSAKILIVKIQDVITSIICDKVIDITKLNKTKIHSLPFNQSGDFYDGVYINNDKNIYILNVENLTKYIEKNQSKFIKPDNQLYLVDDEMSKNILEERKNFTIQEAQDLQTNKALYDMGVSFAIDDIKYYINMASVKEFHKINGSKFIKVPNTPSYICGLIGIKGDYITVLDVRNFFNDSKTILKEKSTLIILNSNEYKIGILADEICESMNVNFDEIIQNRLQKEDGKMMEFVKDGEIYQVLDTEKLFQDERLAIA